MTPVLPWALALLSPAVLAQSAAAPAAPMCPSVVAVVMVGKVLCTAALCNTGTAQGGLSGLLAQAMNRHAIDAVSFSSSVGAQLATALKQTGCFEVFDAVGMEALRKEMESLGKALPPPPTVDYVVTASVTKAEYVVDESSFLGYKKTTATSSLTLDTKLVSAQRGTVSEAGAYDAIVERTASGLALPFYSSNSDAAKRGTPFADVAREAIGKATAGLTTRMLSQVEAGKTAAPSPRPVQAAEASSSAPQ